jgi:Putative Na+/H+ antiporter
MIKLQINFCYFALFVFSFSPLLGSTTNQTPKIIEKIESFTKIEAQKNIAAIWGKISFRAAEEPFLVVASIIFFLAIIHTFFATLISKKAHIAQRIHDEKVKAISSHNRTEEAKKIVCFKTTALHFFGEIEAIFGIWVLVLLGALVYFHSFSEMKNYMASIKFTEPLFVFVIMAISSTRPILQFAEKSLRLTAKLGKESPAAWWLSILIIAPILGSFITEPGAMTIAALLLARKFYPLRPSSTFAYATLGLLFVNISVGGVLTNFAAPPVLMVAGPDKWNLSTLYMLTHFGDKAVIAIIASSLFYYFVFRKELKSMAYLVKDIDGDGIADWQQRDDKIPLQVTITHLAFMVWVVIFCHTPALFIGGFLFFLAFTKATRHHQNPIELRTPLMVGFFLAALVVHGSLQGWWLSPIITSLSEWPLYIGATILTSFNDNAAITFLASQVENLSPAMKYSVLAGAVTGGGLTVIANAPNPAGQSILSKFFRDGVSPVKLFLAALIPTMIVVCAMKLIPDRENHRQLGERKNSSISH